MQRILTVAASALVAVLVLGGCAADRGAQGSAPVSARASFPLTVTNCGREVTITKPPERVLAKGNAAVTLLQAAGAGGKLVGRADKGEAYPPSMEAAVKDVPQLGSSGNLSMEIVLNAAPDLVFGTGSSTINPDTLSPVGIPMLNPSGYCGSGHGPGKSDGTIDFDDVYNDLELYGRIFATEDIAAKAVADYRQRVAAVKERFRDAPKRTAAVLQIYQGGLTAYIQIIANAQLETLGITNAFREGKGYIELSVEELLVRDPDVLVLLAAQQTDKEARDTLLAFSGITKLKAVKNDNIVVQQIYYSAPGALAVEGLENMAKKLLPTK